MRRRGVAHFTAELAERAETARDLRDLRAGLLDLLGELAGCETGYWGAAPGAPADPDGVHLASSSATREALARFSGGRARYDVPEAIQGNRARGGVTLSDEAFTAAQRERLPLYTDVIRPAGIRSYLFCELAFRGQPLSIITLSRHARGSRFVARDKELVASLRGPLGLVEAALRAGAHPAQPSADSLRQRIPLTAREAQVAQLLTRGLRNREIAALLGTSLDTVRKQTIRVYAKAGVTGRVQLLARFGASPGEGGADRLAASS